MSKWKNRELFLQSSMTFWTQTGGTGLGIRPCFSHPPEATFDGATAQKCGYCHPQDMPTVGSRDASKAIPNVVTRVIAL